MLGHYLASHLVACPSTIENSPNSVAEAMILGAPVVAAHVGGVPDMVTHGSDGMTYQADAPYMLAHSISTVFDEPETAARMGARARARAALRHDPDRNARRTAGIYTEILNQEGTS
jgi:glycosyltransferase involved in cell wall biosynthesis